MTNLVTFPDLVNQSQGYTGDIILKSYQGLPDVFDPSALSMDVRALHRVQTALNLGTLAIDLHGGTGTSQQVMSECDVEYPAGVLFGASQTGIRVNGAAVTKFIQDKNGNPLDPLHQACVIDQAIRDGLVRINRKAWFGYNRIKLTALTSGPIAVQALLMQGIDVPRHVISYAALRLIASGIVIKTHMNKYESEPRDIIRAYRKSLFMGVALDRYALGAGIIAAHTFVRPTPNR